MAEAVFAGLLVMAALFLIVNEGIHNWQSLWTAAAFTVFGAALWMPRAAVQRVLSGMPSLSQPGPPAGAGGGFVAAPNVEREK